MKKIFKKSVQIETSVLSLPELKTVQKQPEFKRNQITLRMGLFFQKCSEFEPSLHIKLHTQIYLCKFTHVKMLKNKTWRRMSLQLVVTVLLLLNCGIPVMISFIWNFYSWWYLSFISFSLQSVPIPNVTSGGLQFETKLFLESPQFSNPNYSQTSG